MMDTLTPLTTQYCETSQICKDESSLISSHLISEHHRVRKSKILNLRTMSKGISCDPQICNDNHSADMHNMHMHCICPSNGTVIADTFFFEQLLFRVQISFLFILI